MKILGNNRLALIICCIVAAALLFSYNSRTESYEPIIKKTLDVIAPVEKSTSMLAFSFSHFADDISSFFTGFTENKQLKEKNYALEQYYYLYNQLILENEQLRQELNFTKSYPHKFITANIIARNNSAIKQQITLDAGDAQGIKKWQLVLFHNQLIGRIIEVYDHSSIVLLLGDQNSRIPVISKESKTTFVASGMTTNYLSCKYLDKHSELQEDELIVTSGDELAIIPNLIVGTVFKKEDTFYIKPTLDFDKLEFVYILNP